MRIGTREFDVKNHTYVMGILNATPDSFSDGGKYNRMENMRERVCRMLEEGADIIDVGGESTRPGSLAVPEEEEIRRVLPAIEMIRSLSDVPVSVDTYKLKVAREALDAGADLVNDISCMKEDGMAGLVAERNCCYCLTHNRQTSGYLDFPAELLADLENALRKLERAGASKERLLLDPGIGFAKTQEQNLWLLKHLDMFDAFHIPLLLGASRKSVIGNILGTGPEERLEGTLASTAYAVLHRCGFVRVHDVRENVRFIKMMEAVRDAKEWG